MAMRLAEDLGPGGRRESPTGPHIAGFLSVLPVVIAAIYLWPPTALATSCVAANFEVADPGAIAAAEAAFVGTIVEVRDELPGLKGYGPKYYDTYIFEVEYDAHGNLDDEVSAIWNGYGAPQGGEEFGVGDRLGVVMMNEEGNWIVGSDKVCESVGDADAFLAAADLTGGVQPVPSSLARPSLPMKVAMVAMLGLALGVGLVAMMRRRAK
jgi:hypothetical protein